MFHVNIWDFESENPGAQVHQQVQFQIIYYHLIIHVCSQHRTIIFVPENGVP